MNAVMYLVKTGCQCGNLPKDFPNWKAVSMFYYRAQKKGIWDEILKMLVKKTRKANGRNDDPTYALIDSQSVKMVYNSEKRGFDEKKTKGRKRHIVTDIMGNILAVHVHAANIHDTKGGVFTFEKALFTIRLYKAYVLTALTKSISRTYLKNFII